MFEFDLKMNGRTIRSDRDIEIELEKTAIAAVKDSVRKLAKKFIDPETGLPIRVTVTGRRLDKLKIQAFGSDEIVGRFLKAVNSNLTSHNR